MSKELTKDDLISDNPQKAPYWTFRIEGDVSKTRLRAHQEPVEVLIKFDPQATAGPYHRETPFTLWSAKHPSCSWSELRCMWSPGVGGFQFYRTKEDCVQGYAQRWQELLKELEDYQAKMKENFLRKNARYLKALAKHAPMQAMLAQDAQTTLLNKVEELGLDQKQLLATSFKPPFTYHSLGQAIHDANGDKVIDVRGWGKLQYMDRAEERQDTLGHWLASVLNNQYPT